MLNPRYNQTHEHHILKNKSITLKLRVFSSLAEMGAGERSSAAEPATKPACQTG